jgi:hypothetical protein
MEEHAQKDNEDEKVQKELKKIFACRYCEE